MKFSKIFGWVLLFGKLGLSLFLLWIVFSTLAFEQAINTLTKLHPLYALVALGIIFFQFILASLRQASIIRIFREELSFVESFKAILIGAFFSQTLISFIGGDAMRIWWLKTLGLKLKTVAGAVLLDRVIGFLGLFMLVAVTFPLTLGLVTHIEARWSLITLVGGGAGAILCFFSLGFLPPSIRELRYIGKLMDFMTVSRHMLSAPRPSFKIFAYSIVVQILNVLAIYVLAFGFGLTITFWQCMVLVPPVIFVAMLPISVAGWGLREGAMIVAFGYVGVPMEQALVTSMTFGLTLLAGSLAGVPVWLLGQRRKGELSPA